MRKNLGPKSLIYPMPVLIIGTYDENNKADLMNAAWGGISNTNEICICLSYEHKSTKNIIKQKCFTVSFGTKKYVKECDYVGMVSLNDDKDKIKKSKFHLLKSKNINAPLVKELPLTLECELIKYDKNTGHTFGRIINVVADEEILTNNKIDVKKLEPLVFDGDNANYHIIGKKVGNAFSDYKKIK